VDPVAYELVEKEEHMWEIVDNCASDVLPCHLLERYKDSKSTLVDAYSFLLVLDWTEMMILQVESVKMSYTS